MLEYFSTFPGFVTYFGTGVLLCVGFVLVYVLLTPQREISLIRAGNVCASLCLGGALVGFALPLSSAIAHSVNLIDLALWGAVALVVQIGAYLVVRFWFHDLRAHVEADRVAVGVMVAAVCIAVGLLNAAAMTY